MGYWVGKMYEIRAIFFEWAKWWVGLSHTERLAPLLIATSYPASIVALSKVTSLGGLVPEHFVLAFTAVFLWCLGPRFRTLFYFLLPAILVTIVYDSMRYYGDLIRGPIHVSEPYQFDRFFFGIDTAAGRLTPNEWFQLHLHPVLDVITGFFYLAFIPIYILLSAYFCFWVLRNRRKEERFRPMWAFFWVNVLGYSTYYWYAAAPPWYVAEYGMGPANLQVAASAAGAARFDAILGTSFFSGMYGRAADVFGAVPSLHVAYPLLAVFYAFKYRAQRIFSLIFYIMMCFSAVYLNHHYILDILWGSVYAILVCVVLERQHLPIEAIGKVLGNRSRHVPERMSLNEHVRGLAIQTGAVHQREKLSDTDPTQRHPEKVQ